MTPRELRIAVRDGRMTAVDPFIYINGYPPPLEWPKWKRDRLRAAIRAAILFMRGTGWRGVMGDLSRRGFLKKETVSKARVAQYVKVGIAYLMKQGCFGVVKNSGKKSDS